MFNRDDVVITAAFTGAAAFNVGGKTCHSSFGISPTNPNQEISPSSRERLIREMRYTVALFIDERSMLSASILGAAERNVSMTCHGGCKQHLDWGGIPVVLLWGDDYQLPSVDISGKGKGAFYCYGCTYRSCPRKTVEINGMVQFQNFSTCVYRMTTHQRTNDPDFIELQDRVQIGTPSQDDISTLLSLNIHRVPSAERDRIQNDPSTVFLFATRKKCSEFNSSNLIAIHSESNPIALIISKIPKKLKSSSTDTSSFPQATVLCRGAKVCIRGRNFCPSWGLYNGAIGTVIEIVYLDGQNPNDGHLPLYVLVNFPSYVVPPFDVRNHTYVPIPSIKQYDQETRSEIVFVPLQLSFARTIHTFQGYQAGPQLNIKRLICDVGIARLEATFPGLFYTALSRATTIGSKTDRIKSAIFFMNLDSYRVEHLRGNTEEHTYKIIEKRDRWTGVLKEHTVNIGDDTDESILNTLYTIVFSEIQLIEATGRTDNV